MVLKIYLNSGETIVLKNNFTINNFNSTDNTLTMHYFEKLLEETDNKLIKIEHDNGNHTLNYIIPKYSICCVEISQ